MNKKRVLLISPDVLPIPAVKGGAVETLIDFIIEDNENIKKVDLDVISLYDEKSKQIADRYNNSKLIYIKTNKLKNKIYKLVNDVTVKFFNIPFANGYVRKIRKHLKQFNDYDLIIVENRTHYAMLLKKYIKCKIVLHLHNDFINKETKMAKEVAFSYDEIWGISKYVCDRVGEIKKENVFLIHNGIDVERFINSNTDLELSKQYNIDIKKEIIIFSGRLAKYKGIIETIEAFKKLNKDKYQLLVLGSYDYSIEGTNELEDYIDEIKKNCNNIIFTGNVNYSEINKFYKMAICGVVLSTVNEAFCQSALEMLASGLPVIYTNKGALPEVVNDCGIAVDVNENIIENVYKSLTNKEYLSIKRTKCINRAKEFTKEKYIDRFWSLILK